MTLSNSAYATNILGKPCFIARKPLSDRNNHNPLKDKASEVFKENIKQPGLPGLPPAAGVKERPSC